MMEPQALPPKEPIPPDKPLPDKQPTSLRPYLLGAILIVLVIVTALLYISPNTFRSTRLAQRMLQPSPTPTPTPSYLPPGKQTYNVNQNMPGGIPNVMSITFDPLDVHKNDQQSIDIIMSQATPVQSVAITLYADDQQKQSLDLQPASDATSLSIWHGTWTVQSSVWYRYVIRITAINSAGTDTTYVAPRTVGPIKKTDLN